RDGFMFVHGHVTDRDSGEALDGVRVEAQGISATTNARGYFSMHVPATVEVFDITLALDGYKNHRISNTMTVDGADTHYIVRLDRGAGVTTRDDSHKIWLHRPDGPHPQSEEQTSGPGARGVTIPDTIRVGFDCGTANTCARVEVFSLDTYVKRGLNDEWIASWTDNSLRAGAVAYRSYGAWHVAHPRTTTYDICSTTSCQVNDADTSLRTDLAVDATRGYVLVLNGEIFRSEYSAENNNLLGERSCSNVDRRCGDGFAGSPAAGWPCLSDPVCAGSSCFGHGRGMCQWGTQRWSLLGADWLWIVNHYYNDYGRGSGLRSAVVVGPVKPRVRAVR
ncbi:MAG TPA: SpoIID/LytB domain-containing protein, partial [Thermoanaerobaculia bacterium]|nr:SpoIID/LytB domain-containing protein [Thermoanaerobaculia bacterium]